MTEVDAFAAVDLGAESGRVMVGLVQDEGLALHEAHRFANRPVYLPDGLHWNTMGLLRDTLDGLGVAARDHRLQGIGVDAWGVDYALLDDQRRMLGPPFHYRDPRTASMAQRAYEHMTREELFAATGIQTMPINTMFQLLADAGTPALESAQFIALIPDLVAFWLCAELANETTVASTTGLLEANAPKWAYGVIDALGLPRDLFREWCRPEHALASCSTTTVTRSAAERRYRCSPSRATTRRRHSWRLRCATVVEPPCCAAGRGRCWEWR
ncbi:MAG: FGGY family carbohydrate kinase [Solirubrobacteraceae bacterium]